MTIERTFMIIIGILIFGGIFLTMDCTMGNEEVIKGEVVEKHYEPERRWTTTHPVKIGNVTTIQTQHHYDDPDWLITVQGYDIDGDLQTQLIDLNDQFKWENVDVGDTKYIIISRGKFTGWKY